MKAIFASTLLIFFAVFSGACTQQPPMEEQVPPLESEPVSAFDGAWEFVQLETPDGPATTQRGMMVVSGDYVCHVRVGKERVSMAEGDSDEVTQEKAASLFAATTAACGSYEIDGETLTANWTTSSNPSVEGHNTEFILTREDDRIVLAPAANPQFKFVYRKLN